MGGCCARQQDMNFDKINSFQYSVDDIIKVNNSSKPELTFEENIISNKEEDIQLSKITIREKQYPNPYKSLAVIKHNSFIFDEINKNFLNRQGDLFKQKILNIKKYNNKYKVKMPKIHISNFTRIPFEIPLVDLTEDKDKKGLQTFKNISKKQNEGTLQLYAYYRYPNRNMMFIYFLY